MEELKEVYKHRAFIVLKENSDRMDQEARHRRIGSELGVRMNVEWAPRGGLRSDKRSPRWFPNYRVIEVGPNDS
jgi:hypothetical protein